MSSAPALAPNVLRQYLDPMSTSVDFFVGNLPFLDELSLRVGLPRRYLSLAIATFAATFVLFGLGQSLLCTAVGVLYPAYMSMKALESRPLVPDSMVQWLTYWVCYSIFSSLEVLGDHLLYCALRRQGAPCKLLRQPLPSSCSYPPPPHCLCLPPSRDSLLLPAQDCLPSVAHAPHHQGRQQAVRCLPARCIRQVLYIH